MAKAPVIGIDLGTTYSCVGILFYVKRMIGRCFKDSTVQKDIKLLPKLQVLAEFMIEEPVKHDSFKIAS